MNGQETFIGLRRFLWMWICAGALLVLSVIYRLDDPVGGRNGTTRLGLAYGALSAAGILLLSWYGARKRYSYARGSFTLKSWLAPHVWVGVALVLLVPLHCGFSIHWNLHSAAYFIMLLTVVSGIWGAYAYLRFPSQMKGRREGITMRSCVEQMDAIASEMNALARSHSDAFKAAAKNLIPTFEPTLSRILSGKPFPGFSKAELSALLSSLPKEEYGAGLSLSALAIRRVDVVNRLIAEASVAARMRLWLYFHLPLSLACLLATAAHVFWVFYYRWR